MTRTVNIRIPRDLAEAYRDLARLDGLSFNAACIEGLRRGIACAAPTGMTRAEVDVILAVRRAVAEGAAGWDKADRQVPPTHARMFPARRETKP